eukprot:1226044-Pyramimonas_sp.AAC.1
MASRKCNACYAWTTGAFRDSGEGPHPAHPLWCRESPTLAMHCESYTHVSYIVCRVYVYDVCAA